MTKKGIPPDAFLRVCEVCKESFYGGARAKRCILHKRIK